MKKILLSSLLAIFLIGCSSQPTNNEINRFEIMTGGQSLGDATSYYWYTEQLGFPYSASDYVSSGDYGWYQSDYRWRDGVIREIVREGEQLKLKQGLLPYKLHLRFNTKGEAVYQQYRLDGKVLPFPSEQIALVKKESDHIKTTVKKQHLKGLKLIQGHWDGKEFRTCSGEKYQSLEFDNNLPSVVVERLIGLESYAAFLGTNTLSKLKVTELYSLKDKDESCVSRPVLISE